MRNPSSWLKKALKSTTHPNLALGLALSVAVLTLLLLSGGWISGPGTEAGMVASSSSITSTPALNGDFAASDAPAVITNNASNLDTSSARLNGDLTSKGTAENVTVSFVWDTSSRADPETYPKNTYRMRKNVEPNGNVYYLDYYEFVKICDCWAMTIEEMNRHLYEGAYI